MSTSPEKGRDWDTPVSVLPRARRPWIGSLPSPLNPLIGRDEERASVRTHVEQGARLVTLTGPGGIGKSRLAVQLAADCSARGAGVDLRSCNLSGLNLSGVTLTGADLRGANLRNTNLNGARLAGANLAYTDLRGATFSGANLRGATLTGATVYSDTLNGADVRGANLSVRVVARPVVVSPVVTLNYSFGGEGGGRTVCYANVQLTGFQPDTTYPVRYTIAIDGDVNDFTTDSGGATDRAGNASFVAFGSAVPAENGNTLEANVDGVSSGTRTVAC